MTTENTDTPSGTIIGLFVGQPQDRWPGRPPSAIAKQPVDGPLAVDAHGFSNDQQADLRVHGGPEKALHHYASEHVAFWRKTFPDSAGQFAPGCFGENISTTGLTEDNLCIGDILRFGSAGVQICQGRQPCWKLNAHIGNDAMAAHFQKTGRTGWYYRVVEGGTVAVGDPMTLLERRHPEWPLRRLINARFDPRLATALARELAGLEALSESWRSAFAKKSDRGFTENTDSRLKGTA